MSENVSYRKLGDIPFELWDSQLRSVNSPMVPQSRELYEIVRGHTALWLAQAWYEAKYDTVRSRLKASDHNPTNMKWWPDDPKGKPAGMTGTKLVGNDASLGYYLTFADYPSALREWRRRVIDDPDYKNGVYQPEMTLREYLHTYADIHEVHPDSGKDTSDIYPEVVSRLKILGVWKEESVAKKLHVILVAGHNSVGDGGNPVERKLTPNLAAAYLDAFKRAGVSAEWINPSMFPGGLDGLASATARAIRDADADLVLSLDLHFNGSKSGVHVIPPHNRRPNGGQLSTAIVAGRDPADVMENNTLDVRLAEAYARAIVAANPGMYLWGSNGVMPESQTGVGLNGFRLAMPAYSAPYRDIAVRLTVEHGGTDDASRPDFYRRCAEAVVAATRTVLADRFDGGQPQPEPDPERPEGDPGNPSLASFLFGAVGRYSFNPNGPVSKLWLRNGNESGSFPRLVDVREGTPKYFVFSDGSVIVDDKGKLSYLSNVKE